MPLLKLHVNQTVDAKIKEEILGELSKQVVDAIGKPEKYMMVLFEESTLMMGGDSQVAAFAEVRSIGGLTPDVNRLISERVCGILADSLHIAPDRIYINFIDIARTHWGWNRSTFG